MVTLALHIVEVVVNLQNGSRLGDQRVEDANRGPLPHSLVHDLFAHRWRVAKPASFDREVELDGRLEFVECDLRLTQPLCELLDIEQLARLLRRQGRAELLVEPRARTSAPVDSGLVQVVRQGRADGVLRVAVESRDEISGLVVESHGHGVDHLLLRHRQPRGAADVVHVAGEDLDRLPV